MEQQLRQEIRDEAIKETEAKYKRKVQETFQCVVCLRIPKEGHIIQCQNGHLLCEGCTDNNKGRPCPNCRAPLDRLAGNKRIRALAAEQLIEFMNLDYECKHPNCEFSACKKEAIMHEKKCEHRMVPCPDRCCKQQWPYHRLLEHMKYGKAEDHLRVWNDGVDKLNITITKHQDKNFHWPCRVYIYQNKLFIASGSKVEGVYYFYLHIMGDLEEANRFKVAITIGSGRQSGIIHIGKVFPIDAKMEDVIKEKSGVLSFWQGGMGESLLEDVDETTKKIVMNFKISSAQEATGGGVCKINTSPFSISSGM